jgi:hypothetical protein
MSTKKSRKMAAVSGTRVTPTVTQTRNTRARANSSTLIEPDTSQPDVVKSCEQAHTWLEDNNLLVPLEAKLMLPMLSTTLFHISELGKMLSQIAQAICSVAWLLGESEEETVTEATQSAVNEQIDYLNSEAKNILDGMRTTLSKEVEKNINTLSMVAAKVIEKKVNRPISYRDAALSGVALPHGTNPRILARKGIRLRQFIIDLLGGSSLKNLRQPEVLKRFNEAMDKAAGELGEGARKIRSVFKLNNKGLLGEFMHDDGAKWFAMQSHADAFIHSQET